MLTKLGFAGQGFSPAIRMMFLVLIFSCLALLSSCGGGGGGDATPPGADSVTLSINNGAYATFTEATSLSAPQGYDPYIRAAYTVTNGTMYIYLRNGYSAPTWDEVLQIAINGTTAKTYTIDPGTTVSYTKTSTSTNYITQSGTITVSAYDSVGGHIQGSFDVLVCPPPCVTTSVPMRGTFYATREADQ